MKTTDRITVNAVAVDPGKFNTKAVSKNDGEIVRFICRTKATPTDEVAMNRDHSYVVHVPGLENPNLNNVIFGKRAKDEDVDYDKEKKKDLHKIAVYTAISQLVPNKAVIQDLVVGYPIDLFKNVTARNQFAEYIKGDGMIKMDVNGKSHEFMIERVTVLPESSGIILKHMEKYQDDVVAVIDWGGLNVNGCIFRDGDPVDGTYFVLNKGANVLKNDLKQELNKEFVSNVQDYMMDEVLKDGFIKKDVEESTKFINNFIHSYIIHIKDEAKRKQWDFDNLKKIIFIGGGSIQFETQIIEAFHSALISENAVWDNVEGFFEVID